MRIQSSLMNATNSLMYEILNDMNRKINAISVSEVFHEVLSERMAVMLPINIASAAI